MTFSSLTFLFFFLPAVLILYFLSRNRIWRNAILLVFSLLFYSWGEPKYVLLMLAAALVAYLGGLVMNRAENQARPRLKKTALLISIVLLSGNLFVFKYLNFFADHLGRLFGADLDLPAITLPIGISFYTFQILSYVIDLYRGQIAVQRNYFDLTLYISFFPQLIAGPIVRYQTIEKEIRHRQECFDDVVAGLKRFILGLCKKVLIANNIATVAAIIYDGDPAYYGTAMYWLAALAYALQIYFDFSGYSDMAIGLGQMFGFHFLENFNYPYIACSITDFWRRWHISLSAWFRDYIYIPLGGNRVPRPRWILNLVIVWGLTGFWHGAQWNFLLWGLYYCALLLLEKLFLHSLLNRLPAVVRWIYVMFCVLVGWVIFNRTDPSQLSFALGRMFSFVSTNWNEVVLANSAILQAFLYIPLGLVCMLPLGHWLQNRHKTRSAEGCLSSTCLLLFNLGYCVLLGLSILFIISSTYNPFIYFRF